MTRSALRIAFVVASLVALSVALAVACLALLLTPQAATAQETRQEQRQNTPGQFDFYVLSLPWSPSFCASAAERSRSGAAINAQCGARPYSFVVHGLWAQYERGFPEFCQLPAPRLERGIVSSMLDLMPAAWLIFNEWDRHGTCSGQSPRAYFETVRKARAAVKIPAEFTDLKELLSFTPGAVEDAFIKANPGLSAEAIAVSCDARRLTEVRLCLAKDLHFRDCPEIAKRRCNREQVTMPPMCGG